jgi:hypothetical protein
LRRPGRSRSDPRFEEQVTLSASDSTPSAKPSKPSRPYPDFPLTAHPADYWCKKIRGRIHYFGPWADPDGSLKKYLEQRDDLHAGHTPRPDTGAATVKDVCNAFLNHKQAQVDAGELSPETWAGYKRAADVLVSHTGKARLATRGRQVARRPLVASEVHRRRRLPAAGRAAGAD